MYSVCVTQLHPVLSVNAKIFGICFHTLKKKKRKKKNRKKETNLVANKMGVVIASPSPTTHQSQGCPHASLIHLITGSGLPHASLSTHSPPHTHTPTCLTVYPRIPLPYTHPHASLSTQSPVQGAAPDYDAFADIRKSERYNRM